MLIFSRNKISLVIRQSWFLVAYILVLYGISYAHQQAWISFPHDNILVFIFSLFFTKIFLLNQNNPAAIVENVSQLQEEISHDAE